MAMGDEEEWQVAGHGRHRRCRRDDAKPNKIGSALLRNVHTTHAYTSTTVNFKRAGRRTSVERETGYVYQQTMRAKSARNGTRRILIEERVQEEVRKVKHLAVLLRRTALWASLVEKLETALSTLKIGFVGQPLSLGASLSYSPGTASNGEHRCNTHSWTSPTHAGHHPAETVVGTSREDRRGRTKRGDKGAECRRRMRPARRSSDTDPCILEQDGTAGVLSPSTDRLRCRTEEARTCGSSTRIEATEQDLCKCSTNRLFELVCYGIGNFSDSNTARYQLALALCLRERLFPPGLDSSNNVDPGPVTDLHLEPGDGRQVLAVKTQSLQPVGEKTKNAFQRPVMLVFDPVMGEVETKVLAALGCGVIEINEQGKRGCSEPCAAAGGASDGYSGERMEVRCRPTLFFMPHCPMRLYSNLLWANWSCQALGSTVILGNSLAAYRDRLVSPDVAQDPSNAIAHAENLIQESPVHPYPIADRLRWRRDADALPHLERAFNDLSFSYSGPELRESEAGRIALLNRPTEFVEDSDGELVTGKAVNGGLCRSSFDLQL